MRVLPRRRGVRRGKEIRNGSVSTLLFCAYLPFVQYRSRMNVLRSLGVSGAVPGDLQSARRSMNHSLPQSIANYFSGKNARDYAKALSGVAPDAAVSDEERQHVGAEAIQRWMEESAAKYNDQSQIRGATTDGDRTVVMAEVSGTFPGSPIELRFAFTLQDGLITKLTIDP